MNECCLIPRVFGGGNVGVGIARQFVVGWYPRFEARMLFEGSELSGPAETYDCTEPLSFMMFFF